MRASCLLRRSLGLGCFIADHHAHSLCQMPFSPLCSSQRFPDCPRYTKFSSVSFPCGFPPPGTDRVVLSLRVVTCTFPVMRIVPLGRQFSLRVSLSENSNWFECALSSTPTCRRGSFKSIRIFLATGPLCSTGQSTPQSPHYKRGEIPTRTLPPEDICSDRTSKPYQPDIVTLVT